MDPQAEFESKVPEDLCRLLVQRDGAARLVHQLSAGFRPDDVATPTDQQRAWELCGVFYLGAGRCHDALVVFHALYGHMLAYRKRLANARTRVCH